MQVLPPVPEMQRAFLASDASYNGLFYTAVRTTGIFCLPATWRPWSVANSEPQVMIVNTVPTGANLADKSLNTLR